MKRQVKQTLQRLVRVSGMAVALSVIGAAQGADPKPHRQAPAPTLPGSATSLPRPLPRVTEQKTVRDILRQMERVHGVHVVLDPSVDESEPAPLMPPGMSSEQRLQGLFVRYDLMFAYGPDRDTGMNRLKRVWVLPRGYVEAIQAAPAVPGSLPAVAHANPEDPSLALQQLSELPHEDAKEMLTRALSSDDENARLQAIGASITNTNLPVGETLQRMALDDPSETLRAQALEALSVHPNLSSQEFRSILSRSVSDPSPLVRDLAESLKEALDSPLEPALPAEN